MFSALFKRRWEVLERARYCLNCHAYIPHVGVMLATIEGHGTLSFRDTHYLSLIVLTNLYSEHCKGS